MLVGVTETVGSVPFGERKEVVKVFTTAKAYSFFTRVTITESFSPTLIKDFFGKDFPFFGKI